MLHHDKNKSQRVQQMNKVRARTEKGPAFYPNPLYSTQEGATQPLTSRINNNKKGDRLRESHYYFIFGLN